MSNNKHFADLLKVCSILPALAIMPAMGEDYVVQSGISVNVKKGETKDWSQSDGVLFDEGAVIRNYGTVKLGGDVRFENATVHNYYSSTEEQSKIVYDGDGNITFFDSRISNPGIEYDKETPAIIGGLVDFKTTGDISFSGDMAETGSSAFVNTTVLSDMILQANKISVSGGKSSGYGGAIFNAGDLKLLGKENLFQGNSETAAITDSKDTKYFKLGGGALYNRGAEGTAEMVIGLADGSSVNKFIANSAVQNGGAIEARTDDPNSSSVVDIIGTTTFSENTAGVNGGAIMNWVDSSKENASSIVNVIGKVNFDTNTAGEHGGAIYNNGTLDLSNATAEFKENSATQYGGAIYNSGTFVLNNAKFHDNTAEVGGAFFVASGSDMTISNSEFAENFATYGGVGYTSSKLNNLTIVDSVLRDNTATGVAGLGLFNQAKLERVDFERNISSGDNSQGGGAVFLGSEAKIDIVEGTFVGNEVKTNGGAIGMRTGGQGGDNSAATLSITGTEFSTNFAANGGAIYNTFYNDADNSGAVSVSSATFANNIASVNGGAVYNDGSGDAIGNVAVMHFDNNVTFSGNEAGNIGGAIYNGSGATVDMSDAIALFSGNKSTVDGGAIYNDADAVLKIGDAKFSDNRASYDSWESEGYGGAIFALGDLDIVSDKENGVVFSNNVAYAGGAVYGSKNSKIGMNIENALFDGNHAVADAGALGIFNNDVSKLDGVEFRNNTVAVVVDGLINADDIVTPDGGGAIQLGGTASADLTDVHFVKNESGVRGGAISARHGKDYELNISESSFTTNIAGTNGGAIANVYAGALAVKNVDFIGNNAGTNGGAIYNGSDWNFGGSDVGAMSSGDGIVNISGENLFSGNIASGKGGAIYNGAYATVNMSGDNTFVDNIANNGANDIYNDGALNITGGTTTIGGGISGNGTLTLAEGATLDIGNTTISQDVLDIDGIVKASVLSDRSYGRLLAGKTLDVDAETAELHLSLGSVGEYNMFGGKDAGFSKIVYGNSYLVEELDNGIIKVTTKAVEDLAADTGLTTQAAGAIAVLANSHDATMHNMSLAAQQALNSGDASMIAMVERETKKLNPTDKPVAQAAATSVQNQVLSLAAGRMSGGAVMGRAGGDEIAQENGFWVQGLFNKSKFADEFHGYTRGVALGADTTIDKTWTVGAGLAFNNSDVHADGVHTDIDSKTLFVYGQYKPSNWFVNGTATYTMSEYTDSKTVFDVIWNDSYDVNSYGAQIMGGYDFATGITTEAGLRYLHIAQDATGFARAVDTDFLMGVAGVKYAFAIENDWAIKLRPELRAAMTYDMISDDASATVVMPGVASYKVDGESLSRMGGEFGIGLTADYKGIKVSLMYDLNLHKDYASQTGMIKFRSQF